MSLPRCKQNKMAWVKYANIQRNIGRMVTTSVYVGYFNAGDTFEYNGISGPIAVTDHWWWVDCPGGLETLIGETSRAFMADSWLEPIDDDLLKDDEETGDEIYNIIPSEELSKG